MAGAVSARIEIITLLLFDERQARRVCSSLPNNVFAKSNGTAPVDLKDALSKATKPTLILQPQIEPEIFRDIALTNIGAAKDDLKFIPKMSGHRHDCTQCEKAQSN